MHLTFLTPRVDLLSADGSLEALHPGGALGRLRRPVLLLARELCSFQLFESAALPRSRRRQAARLHAKLASPYLLGGAALVRAGGDFGLWWWDLQRIPKAASDHWGGTLPAMRPETLAQPLGTGWRIVRLRSGFEGQLWNQGALVASAWRREAFDASSWRAFTRLQRGFESSDSPPPAQTLPVDYRGEAFSLARAEVSREQAFGAAAGGFAIAACAAAMFLLGQGLQLRDQTGRIRAEAAEMRIDAPSIGALQSLETDRRRLADYQRLEEATNPISAVGAAIAIVAFHDITPSAVEAGQEEISLTLPYTAVGVADELIEEFEGSGYFYDVRPHTESASQTLIVEMKVREAAPPLSAVD